jgi:hypothetical protein
MGASAAPNNRENHITRVQGGVISTGSERSLWFASRPADVIDFSS